MTSSSVLEQLLLLQTLLNLLLAQNARELAVADLQVFDRVVQDHLLP